MGLLSNHETLSTWHSTKKWCSSVSKNICNSKDFKCMWESVMMVISITVQVMMEVVEMMAAVVMVVVMMEVVMRLWLNNVGVSMNSILPCSKKNGNEEL